MNKLRLWFWTVSSLYFRWGTWMIINNVPAEYELHHGNLPVGIRAVRYGDGSRETYSKNLKDEDSYCAWFATAPILRALIRRVDRKLDLEIARENAGYLLAEIRKAKGRP